MASPLKPHNANGERNYRGIDRDGYSAMPILPEPLPVPETPHIALTVCPVAPCRNPIRQGAIMCERCWSLLPSCEQVRIADMNRTPLNSCANVLRRAWGSAAAKLSPLAQQRKRRVKA